MKLHPRVIEEGGKPAFVVLPFAEYEALCGMAEDYEDVQALREAQEETRGEVGVPLAEVVAGL